MEMVVSLDKMMAEGIKGMTTRGMENLQIYKIEKPEINIKKIRDIGRKFGLLGDPQLKDDIYLLNRKNKMLAVYKNSGAFSFCDVDKLHNSNYTPSLPSEAEASDIAKDYLTSNGWLPANVALDGIHINSFEIIKGSGNKDKSIKPNNISIDYRLSIDGINTFGPGAKIKVSVGNKGEIIGLTRAVPSVRKERTSGIRTEDISKIVSAKIRAPLNKVEGRGMKLAYEAESFALESRFMQPIHIIDIATQMHSKKQNKTLSIASQLHPIPATTFAPIVVIKGPPVIEIKEGEPLSIESEISGGTPPFKIIWESSMEGHLGEGAVLRLPSLLPVRKHRMQVSQTIKVTVTDRNGMHDSHQILVKVLSSDKEVPTETALPPQSLDQPCLGVEWCNLYHGTPGLADISGTDPSALGFKNAIHGNAGWTAKFDYGNDSAWEQDFKFLSAPGGGTDYIYADNVDFVFFAGHGSPGAFYFGSNLDDHQLAATDARWGDGILKWIVLHACNTMMNNFDWDVWCNSFKGLHQMFGFHTTTDGSNPSLGSRFGFWLTFSVPPWFPVISMQSAWEQACAECFDSSVEYAVVYANQSGTDTQNDHLPKFGYVSPDPKTPNTWSYYKESC
jgi:hypothetical protein